MTRKVRQQGLMITTRDLEMLWSLSQARYLTVQALEWLHVPHWRTRWRRWHEQQPIDNPTPYRSSTRLYDRLHRLEQAGLVLRIRRPVSLAVSTFRREPDLYALSERGAQVLTEFGGIDHTVIHYDVLRQRSFLTLAHAAEIGRVYAALRAKIEATAGLELTDWQGDHLTAQDYDRLDVRIPRVGGGTTIAKLPIQPDGTFQLAYAGGAVRYFLEVDRGRPIHTWIEKMRAYHAYEGSLELHARYGVSSFVLLALTINPTQQQKLMEATAQVLGHPSDRYLFSLFEHAHPMTIGEHWHKVSHVMPALRHVPTDEQVQCASIITEPHVLIR